MKDVDVVIAGGGIGGLTLALTLHQIGVSCMVLETARGCCQTNENSHRIASAA